MTSASPSRSFVLDLQACQCVSRFRGIGRYSLAFTKAFIAVAQAHRVSVLLNGVFPESAAELSAKLGTLLPPERIVTWTPKGPTAEHDPSNRARRELAERERERFVASLSPDLVHVASLFEGFPDDTITSIGECPGGPPTAVTLYDLIPLVYREHYLEHAGVVNELMSEYYFRKLAYARRADVVVTISEATRDEAIDLLGLPPARVVNISTSADAMFRPLPIAAVDAATLGTRLGLGHDFVMYTGGPDRRKNIEALVRAWARIPAALRADHQLLVVCALGDAHRARLLELARACGLADGELCLPGYVSDDDLVALYNLAAAFVFPSWHEGFGLPVLEAMACGTAVIASNTSSLPEVVGRADALFDPRDEQDMAAKLQQVLTDDAFRASLRSHGLARARTFTWAATAGRALSAFEAVCNGDLDRVPPSHAER